MQWNKFLRSLNLLLEIFLNPIVLIVILLIGFVFDCYEFSGAILSIAIILRHVTLNIKGDSEKEKRNTWASNIYLLILSLVVLAVLLIYRC